MKKLITLNEEINRMKSLFGESRLYGNLVSEDTEPSPDKVKEVMEPIKKDTLKILSDWKTYNNGLPDNDPNISRFSKRNLGKSIVNGEIEKAESIIRGIDSKDFCSDATLSKIENNRKNLEETERENSDILTQEDKGFISSLKGKMNLLKSECQRLKSEIENNTDVVDNSEEETDLNVITINLDNTVEGCPPVDDDGCMVVTEKTLKESMVDGVLDIYKLFGFDNEYQQKCGTPKMKIPEELLSSITGIEKLEYPFMFESDNGDIELCIKKFPNVTTIKQLVFDSYPLLISEFLPNLKNVDDLFIDDFELFYDSEDYSKVFSNLSVTNIFAVTEGTSDISFTGFKDQTLVSKNVKNIEVNLVKGFDEDSYFKHLIDWGWTEKEGGDGVTFLTNPNYKVQDLDQVNVIRNKEETEEESNDDEVEVQSVEEPKEEKPKPNNRLLNSDGTVDIIRRNYRTGSKYVAGKLKKIDSKNGVDTFVIKNSKSTLLNKYQNTYLNKDSEKGIKDALKNMGIDISKKKINVKNDKKFTIE